jgi:uncharacterized membrane-anchored protein
MNKKYILLALFVVLVATQLYVPASMIMDQEDILAAGKTFRFRTAPVDPNDPFRGKYITLNFSDNTLDIPDSTGLISHQVVYVMLGEDENGFAIIREVLSDPPMDGVAFVKAELGWINNYDDTTTLFINYPFDRFYLEESKAPIAEELYVDSQQDSLKTTWAIVKIKDGNAVLEDVMIDGVSIVEIVRNSGTN